jgi:transcriptional regulator NrdR family protein
MNVRGPLRPPSVPCPICGEGRSRVVNTRPSERGVYRRRICVHGHRFSTEETHRAYAQPRKEKHNTL